MSASTVPAEGGRWAGWLADGTRYLFKSPVRWNGTLLLYSHGPPTPVDGPAWPEQWPLVQALLGRGYAIAGCGTDVFYPLEENLPHQIEMLDMFEQVVARPQRTIAWGESIGGLMTAALVQVYPDRFSGALPLCGPLAGGAAHWNQDLDCSFVFKTLIAPGAPLDLVHIARPPANLEMALALLSEAQATPVGRARIALAAAVRQVPGWCDPAAPEPGVTDATAREVNQFRWIDDIVLLVALSARRLLEDRADGNPSSNTESDYAALLHMSTEAAAVEALYRIAGLDLADDLRTLSETPRIAADPVAVEYFVKYLAFNGDLGGVPVLTVHTRGDGLCPVEHEHAYSDVVHSAGNDHLLRQLYIDRAGHCSYSPAEVLTALTRLEDRIESGTWPTLQVDELNRGAAELGPMLNTLPPAMVVDMRRAGKPVGPEFVEYRPGGFSRPPDARTSH